MIPNIDPESLIRRPDGSYIDYVDLEIKEQLSHDLAMKLFGMAEPTHAKLAEIKKFCLSEFRAHREMMFNDHGKSVGGKDGGFSVKSACGKFLVRMTVAKHMTMGPEVEIAKQYFDECLDEWTANGAPEIREIVESAWQVNKEGKVNARRILELRKYKFTDPKWIKALELVEEAICNDSSTTYINFYHVDTERHIETRLPLDFAKV